MFSEFGRRVRENGIANEAGTDHGAGGLMFAMGSAVRGGFAADWPGCELTELTNQGNPNQGNLWVATDYRSVYYSVLADGLTSRTRRACWAARSSSRSSAETGTRAPNGCSSEVARDPAVARFAGR